MVVIVVMSFELLVLHGGQLGRDDLTGGGDSQGDRPVAQPAEVQLHRLDLDLTPSAWRGGRGGREGGHHHHHHHEGAGAMERHVSLP